MGVLSKFGGFGEKLGMRKEKREKIWKLCIIYL
jgi:hypothetical protein